MRILYLLILIGATLQVNAQNRNGVQFRETTCNLDVDAGEDIVLCNGEPGQLNGSASGDITSVEWTPPIGLSDPNSLSPTVDVSTQTVYTLTVMGIGGNVIENGDFETGNISPATSSLAFHNPGTFYAGPQGTYTVTSVFQVTGVPNVCDPHGGGNMMVVHGGSPNMWCQTVSVEPMTDYKFSGWFMGADFLGLISTTDVDVYINGQNIGGTGGNGICTWNEVKAVWNSGGATSATICIDGSGDGSSWTAIDDLELVECCIEKDQVTVRVEKVQANIPFGGVLTCTAPTLMLDGQRFSKGPIVSYEWDTDDGEIVDGQYDPIVTVGHKGTYNLTVTGELGCTDETSILVEGNTEPPPLTVDNTHLTCQIDSARIIAEGMGEELVYHWTGPDSFSSSKAIDTVENGGKYYVEIIDKFFCKNKDSVLVKDFKTNKSYSIGIDSLSCQQDSALIYLIGDTLISEYSWTKGQNTTTDTNQIVVYDTGVVQTVFKDKFGCVWRDTLHIEGETSHPNLSIQGDTITCSQPEIMLSAYSDSLIMEYQWSLPNGTTSTGKTLLTQDTGWHYVTVTPVHGCMTIDSFYVHQVGDIPSLSIQGDTINCTHHSVTLTGTSDGQSLIPLWSGPGIVQTNGLSAEINQPGIYTLQITTPEGCEKSISYEVIADTVAPNVVILGGDIVNCLTPSVRIYPYGDSTISYQWNVPPQVIRKGDTIITDVEGWHYLSGTSDNTCSSIDSIYIQVDTARPPFLLDKIDFTCRSGIGQASVSPQDAGTYYWRKPGESTFFIGDTSIIVTEEGWIYFKEVYSNSCAREDSIYVSVDTLGPIPIVKDDTLDCGDDQLTLNLIIRNPYEMVEWSGANGFSSSDLHPVIREPGDYTVTVTSSNGCTGTATLHIEQVGAIPDLTIQTPDTITCSKSAILLEPQSSFNNLSYNWTFPDGSQHTDASPSVQDSGWYTLTVKTPEGCTKTTRIYVAADTERPMVSWSVDTLTCSKLETVISPLDNPGGITYQWRGPNGYSDQSAEPKNINISGNYIVAYQGLNGCIQIDTLFVPEDRVPPSLFTQDDTLDCQTNSALLDFKSSTKNLLVRWLDARGNQLDSGNTLSVLDTGIYMLVIEDLDNHCTTQRTIQVFPPNQIQALAIEDNQDCVNPKAMLEVTEVVGGTPPYQYALDNGPFGSKTSWETDPGTKTIQVKDSKGCSYTEQFQIDPFIRLTADIIQDLELFLGEQIQVKIQTNRSPGEIIRYTWDPTEGLSCTNCPDPIITPTSNTVYTIVIEDLFGCTDTISLRVKVKTSDKVYIPNTFTPQSGSGNSSFKIYLPKGTDADILNWKIYDRWGEVVDVASGIKVSEHKGWRGQFKGKSALPGVYVYQITLRLESGKIIHLTGDVTLLR